MRSSEVRPHGTETYWRGLRRRLGVALLAGAVLLVVAAWHVSDDTSCAAEVDEENAAESNYGDAEWSWMPIGTACRWTEEVNGFDADEEPGWVPTIVIAGMLAGGFGLVLTSLPKRSEEA